MKIKQHIIYLLFAAMLFSGVSFAQEKDEYGNYNLKKLSEEDAKRIFGDMYSPKLFKVNGNPRHIKESIISGNKITTILFNYGSICAPQRLGNIADLVWQGLGYGFEFGPLAAAEVDGAAGEKLQIVSDSFIRTFQGDYDPSATLKWGWLPKSEYVDTTVGQNEIARLNVGDKDGDGKPDSWPESWYSPGAGKYVWPAFLGDQATAPDEEVFFVVDDYTNAEFNYYPFPNDSTKRGLGLDMAVRVIQFNNPLAEDIMFLVYQITNASKKDLTRAYFGMHGDPHVGGPSDYSDDMAGFIDPFGNSLQLSNVQQRSRNMVYSWDKDMKGDGGRAAGYFGWKFLESPSNAQDLFDNDDDGIRDEDPSNGAGNFVDGVSFPLVTPNITDVAKYTAIFGAPKPRFEGDEDGDWDPDKNDIGIDGIGPDSPNYPGADFGEGDGEPSQAWFDDLNGDGIYDTNEPLSKDRFPGYLWAGSEPNFGMRDISESDQIGLSSFHAATYSNSLPNVPMNDPLMWEWLSSDTIDTAQELLSTAADNVFNFGTGPLALKVGESQRFSMAILFGNDIQDLILNAETSTRILEADYRFAQPPAKPIVQTFAGDGKVTLYWDTRAEDSVDPLTGKKDFQGYKIYRSHDYTFADVFTITDGRGNAFLGKPIAQFDLVDSLSGFHPVEYAGRAVKYYLGDNTGLVHEYIDSTVTNGLTYYYAVVAFDSGTNEIPPSENQTVILKDPITSVLTYESNTAMVIPKSKSAGVAGAEAGIGGTPKQIKGNSTGPVNIFILDDYKVENKLYSILFTDAKTYTVLDSTGITQEFVSKDTVFADLEKTDIDANSVQIFEKGGVLVDPSKYFVNVGFGKIRGQSPGDLPAGEIFTAKYRYYPVYKSTKLDSSDANPHFNGMKIYVKNHILDLDEARSEWSDGTVTNVRDSVLWDISNSKYIGNPHVQYRADWEFRWLGADTLSDGTWANPGDTILAYAKNKFVPSVAPFNVVNMSEVDASGKLKKGNLLIDESNAKVPGNGRWNWGEPLLLRPTGAAGATVSYYVNFSWKKDSLAIKEIVIDDTTTVLDTTIIKFPRVYPKNGDIFHVRTSKPFETGDKYELETKAVKFNPTAAKSNLDKISVVPNPYVAYGASEQPGRTAEKRGDRELQFRNLPPECSIRIYTLTGELVQKIEKNDMSSIASWDLLSFEGQRIAYGVYIYHVNAPGVGEVIKRFAVIK
ncbi:MAG: hypothetical protein ABIG69_04645 [Bacteroidota bacterium]